METIIAGVIAFTGIILVLVLILYVAKTQLTGGSSVNIQDEHSKNIYSSATGITLLESLHQQKIFLASACGGKGVCGECMIKIKSGGGAILSTEEPLITPRQERNGFRLACQVKVKQNMVIALPTYVTSTKSMRCIVESNPNVATFIKELTLKLPAKHCFDFQAGDYIEVICPPYQASYKDFEIQSKYHDRWDQMNLWRYNPSTPQKVTRSYSLASAPMESGTLKLNVRIAPPPADKPKVPPGVVSSYLFQLKAGDSIEILGPFGKMHVPPGQSDLVFIGGGAGMAPMRSMILDQLKRVKTRRPIHFYYGARSLCEVFYKPLFDDLEKECANFQWSLALSSPEPTDHWEGPTGNIDQVALSDYLDSHKTPEDIEYFLCGPPVMVNACLTMLDNLGVEPENIHYDKFG